MIRKKYILLILLALLLKTYSYSQIDTLTINSLNGMYLRDDCPDYSSFSITCSGYYLEDGNYYCFFSSDVVGESWKGTYRIKKNKIIFHASKFRTKRYKLKKNNENIDFFNKKDFFIYHKTKYSKEIFMKSWNKYNKTKQPPTN